MSAYGRKRSYRDLLIEVTWLQIPGKASPGLWVVTDVSQIRGELADARERIRSSLVIARTLLDRAEVEPTVRIVRIEAHGFLEHPGRGCQIA